MNTSKYDDPLPDLATQLRLAGLFGAADRYEAQQKAISAPPLPSPPAVDLDAFAENWMITWRDSIKTGDELVMETAYRALLAEACRFLAEARSGREAKRAAVNEFRMPNGSTIAIPNGPVDDPIRGAPAEVDLEALPDNRLRCHELAAMEELAELEATPPGPMGATAGEISWQREMVRIIAEARSGRAAREALRELLKILKEHWPKLEHGPACKFGHPYYGECDCRTGEIFDAMNVAEAALRPGGKP